MIYMNWQALCFLCFMRVGCDCAGMLDGVGGGRNGKEHHSFFLHPGLLGCVKNIKFFCLSSASELIIRHFQTILIFFLFLYENMLGGLIKSTSLCCF